MKKKVMFDMILNIVSAAIPTAALQLIILPSIASYVGEEKYGLIITIIAVLNVIPSTMGNVLNNIRLMYEEQYKQENYKGDFSLILVILETINAIIIFICSCYYYNCSGILDIILVVFTAILWLGREYHIVVFRIKLNFRGILFNNLFLVVGYLAGYFLFRLCGYWQLIYIFGILMSYAYIIKNSEICQEPLHKTKLWRLVTRDTMLLLIAAILARAISYADKMLLYPLLGGTMVSVYYAATILGKIASMVISPMNSVALSYLSKISKKPDALFRWAYLIGAIVCVIGYILIMLISQPILAFLYPNVANEAMKYVHITSATIVVESLTTIITPFVLKFFDVKWQICINGFATISYIMLSFILLKYFGLMGFCVAALIANVIKLMVTTCIYLCTKEKTIV